MDYTRPIKSVCVINFSLRGEFIPKNHFALVRHLIWHARKYRSCIERLFYDCARNLHAVLHNFIPQRLKRSNPVQQTRPQEQPCHSHQIFSHFWMKEQTTWRIYTQRHAGNRIRTQNISICSIISLPSTCYDNMRLETALSSPFPHCHCLSFLRLPRPCPHIQPAVSSPAPASSLSPSPQAAPRLSAL